MLAGMPDESDPPRKVYQLKPTEFERVNAPRRDPAPDATCSPDSPPDSGRIDVRDLIKQGSGSGPALGVNGPVNRDNEVHALLRHNVARDNAAGLNDVAPRPKRRSRRKRDYWLLLIPVNLFFAFAAFGPYANPLTFVYGIAGFILFTISLTWVMWGVMDDY
jgi:hypothetical protein